MSRISDNIILLVNRVKKYKEGDKNYGFKK